MKNGINNTDNADFSLDKGGESNLPKTTNFAGFSQNIRNYMAAGLALIGAEMQGQQDPNHPDNTYLSTEQVDVWTTHTAAQTKFDTPAERQNFIWREALVQYNALHGGHKDLAHYVPHQHSTGITESGNLHDDMGAHMNKVADGTMPSLPGALHILRVHGSNNGYFMAC